MTLTRQVAVVDLYVECSLRVRNFESHGLCMSDCCGKTATTAVQTRDGHSLYRCPEHKGIITLQKGPIVETVPVKVDCPEELDDDQTSCERLGCVSGRHYCAELA